MQPCRRWRRRTGHGRSVDSLDFILQPHARPFVYMLRYSRRRTVVAARTFCMISETFFNELVPLAFSHPDLPQCPTSRKTWSRKGSRSSSSVTPDPAKWVSKRRDIRSKVRHRQLHAIVCLPFPSIVSLHFHRGEYRFSIVNFRRTFNYLPAECWMFVSCQGSCLDVKEQSNVSIHFVRAKWSVPTISNTFS